MGWKSTDSVRICSIEKGEWQDIYSGWGSLCRRYECVG